MRKADLVNIYLEFGASVNQLQNGEYPLNIAVSFGDETIAQLLLNYNAYPNTIQENMTPLQLAIANLSKNHKYFKIIEILLKAIVVEMHLKFVQFII